MSNQQLAIRPSITPSVWEMVRQMAPVMYNSRLFGVSSADAAAATLLKGMELGFGPAASFEFIQVIQGKPQLIPRGALAILHGSPLIEKIMITKVLDATGVYIGHECYIKRTNGFEYTARFTLADAQRAGLVKAGGAWEAYPQNMCLWRAVGFAADVAAPDLTAGATLLMKSPEQYGVGLNESGDVIEGVVTPAAQPSILDRLVETLGPEKVMEANGGSIPVTEAEIAAVAEKLKGEIPW